MSKTIVWSVDGDSLTRAEQETVHVDGLAKSLAEWRRYTGKTPEHIFERFLVDVEPADAADSICVPHWEMVDWMLYYLSEEHRDLFAWDGGDTLEEADFSRAVEECADSFRDHGGEVAGRLFREGVALALAGNPEEARPVLLRAIQALRQQSGKRYAAPGEQPDDGQGSEDDDRA